MAKLKVCAYARVSTNKNDQLNSMENQKTYFENYVDRNKDICLVNIYADGGLTGTKLNNRPAFKKMLQDAGIDVTENYATNDKRVKKCHILYDVSDRKPLFDEIWIKNTSRFARNTMSYEIINKLRQKNINIWFIEQNINTKNTENDFLLKLFQVFDEQDSKDKSNKVLFGIKEGARKGVINANSNLYGYKYIQKENRLEIIPSEAKVIKIIYKLYSQNYGIRRIINYLDKNNIHTRKGKKFCRSSINRILSNEKYYGANIRMKYSTGSVLHKNSYPVITTKDNWIINRTDKIPPIISEELFNKCRTILKSKVNYKNNIGVYRGSTPYAGKIICGKCGSTYVANTDRGRRFYTCKTKRLQGAKACNNKNISEKQLNDKVITNCNYKNAILFYQLNYTEPLKGLAEQLKKHINTDDTVMAKALNDKLDEYEEQESRLLDVYVHKLIGIDLYKKKETEIKSNIAATQNKLYAITKPINELNEDIQGINATIKEIKNIKLKQDEYTRDEIIADIDKIIVDGYEPMIGISTNINGVKVSVHYKMFEKVKKIASKYKADIDGYLDSITN